MNIPRLIISLDFIRNLNLSKESNKFSCEMKKPMFLSNNYKKNQAHNCQRYLAKSR